MFEGDANLAVVSCKSLHCFHVCIWRRPVVSHAALCAVLALAIVSAEQADHCMFKGGVMIFLMQSADQLECSQAV